MEATSEVAHLGDRMLWFAGRDARDCGQITVEDVVRAFGPNWQAVNDIRVATGNADRFQVGALRKAYRDSGIRGPDIAVRWPRHVKEIRDASLAVWQDVIKRQTAFLTPPHDAWLAVYCAVFAVVSHDVIERDKFDRLSAPWVSVLGPVAVNCGDTTKKE